MTDDDKDQMQADPATRFCEFLNWAKKEGISQTEVAKRLGVPRQYVTNVKAGSRVLTELFARRVAEEFDVDYLWLLRGTGAGIAQRPSVASQSKPTSVADPILLPLLYELFSGEPRRSPSWDGAMVSITGPALYAASDSEHPYVYRAENGSTGRFKRGDLLLICQGDKEDPPSQLVLLELDKRRTLAWRTGDGRWKSAFTGRAVSTKAKTVGHCLGVIWAHF